MAYCSPDPAVAQALLSRYGVRYVYVGRVERQRYLEQSIPEDQRRALPPECRAGREAVAAGLAKFGQFMDVVFRNQEVVIYRVRGAPP